MRTTTGNRPSHRAAKVAAVVGSVLLLTGCAVVYAPAPFGTDPWPLDPAQWQGRWQQTDANGGVTVLQVTVTDAKAATLVVENPAEPTEPSITVQLRRVGEVGFASYTDPKDDRNRYIWARLDRDGGRLLIRAPAVAEFRKLVQAGAIPGDTREDDVYLGTLDAAHYQRLAADADKTLFETDEPLVLTR